MAKKLNSLHLGDNVYDSFPDKDARQLIEELSNNVLPSVTEADNNKILQVINGKWTLVSIVNGNEVAY